MKNKIKGIRQLFLGGSAWYPLQKIYGFSNSCATID